MRPLRQFKEKVLMEPCLIRHPLANRIKAIAEDIDYRQRPICWEIRLFRLGYGEPDDSGYQWSRDLPKMPEEYDSCHIRIITRVADITNPNPEADPIDLYLPTMTIHPNFTDEQILSLTYNMIRTLEMHELDEHFFFRGVKVKDPHKNDPPRKKEPELYDRQARLVG